MSQTAPPTTFREMYASARLALCSLVSVAQTVASIDQRYLSDLSRAWDDRLAACEKEASERPLPPEAAAAYAYLASTIASEALDDDALAAWLDAFPEAVVDLGRNWDSA
jgi:hypothetical protein